MCRSIITKSLPGTLTQKFLTLLWLWDLRAADSARRTDLVASAVIGRYWKTFSAQSVVFFHR